MAASILILSPLLQNFHVVLPTKTCLFCFLSLALDFCRTFSRWALACRLLSFFLSLSLALYSKFVDMTITPSLILEKTRIPRHIVAFRFRLHWLFSCLCFTRRGWLCDFPSKLPRVAFGLQYLLIELFYIGMPVVRTDGRAVGRWAVRWIPNFIGWVVYHIFLPMVLRCARFARESSAIIHSKWRDNFQHNLSHQKRSL